MRKVTALSCLLSLVLILAICGGFTVNFAKSDACIGVWETPEKDGHIEVYKKKKKDGTIVYNGKINWGNTIYMPDGSLRKDTNNPNEKLRSRTLLGMNVLRNFKYDPEDNLWKEGSVYDPTTGKTYKCRMEVEDGKLHVRGYIGFSLIGKTVVWTRLKK